MNGFNKYDPQLLLKKYNVKVQLVMSRYSQTIHHITTLRYNM